MACSGGELHGCGTEEIAGLAALINFAAFSLLSYAQCEITPRSSSGVIVRHVLCSSDCLAELYVATISAQARPQGS